MRCSSKADAHEACQQKLMTVEEHPGAGRSQARGPANSIVLLGLAKGRESAH